MEGEGSLPCSQELSTGPYPEASSRYHTFLFLWDPSTSRSFHLKINLNSLKQDEYDQQVDLMHVEKKHADHLLKLKNFI
jgi:hypothetical protein